MPQQPCPSETRDNPFWAYRDPRSGRWVTLMTSEQCHRLKHRVFMPRPQQSTSSWTTTPGESDNVAP